MRMLPLQALLVGLCMSLVLHADELSHALEYRPSDRLRWMQASENLMHIEANLYRTLLRNPEEIELYQTLFQSHPLHYLNYLINTRTPHEAVSIATELIEILPPFECTSYGGFFIGHHIWRALNINTVFRNSGFLHTYGALHTAHVSLFEAEQPTQTYKAIIRIKGKQGRLFNTFIPESSAKQVWKPGHFYKIVGKDSKPAQQEYFLDLEEITFEEASYARHIIDLNTGKRITLPGRELAQCPLNLL